MNAETQTTMTHHARCRSGQRVGLKAEVVQQILDNNLVVDVGTEPGSTRRHLLFYSPYDDQPFVAIRDEETKEVITILNLKYHSNLAWEINRSDIRKAKELSSSILRLIDEMYSPEPVKEPPQIRVSVIIQHKTKRSTILSLGSFPSSQLSNPNEIEPQEDVMTAVQNLAVKKGVNGRAEMIILKMGKITKVINYRGWGVWLGSSIDPESQAQCPVTALRE